MGRVAGFAKVDQAGVRSWRQRLASVDAWPPDSPQGRVNRSNAVANRSEEGI